MGVRTLIIFAFLLLILAFSFYLIVIRPYWQSERADESRLMDEAAKNAQYNTLTSLPKEDYDFLVANGLEAPPEVARFFYGSDTPANLAAEQRKAIAGQEAWLALRRGYRKGERQEEVSKGRQMADWVEETYGFDPVMLRQVEKQKEFKSWIDTEKIRG